MRYKTEFGIVDIDIDNFSAIENVYLDNKKVLGFCKKCKKQNYPKEFNKCECKDKI